MSEELTIPASDREAPSSREERLRWQQSLLRQVADPQLELVAEMFDDIPGPHFFAKDRLSRFFLGSRSLIVRLGLSRLEDLVSTSDDDHFPPAIAGQFIESDRLVMSSGEPLRNFREMRFHRGEGLSWSITSKWPLRDRSGEVIGVAGITRVDAANCAPPSGDGAFAPLADIDRVVAYIAANRDHVLTNEELARAAGLSRRQLSRRLRQTHNLSPRNFATLTRIQLACECLAETETALADVAIDHGFADQSSFSNQFRKFTGITPGRFRKRWRRKNE